MVEKPLQHQQTGSRRPFIRMETCERFTTTHQPEVTKRIHEIVTQYSLPVLKGHSLRIGGTLHYLLLGTPFDIVKTMGRWSGDSFTKYLRKHAIILAPYLQERPEMIEKLTAYAMPPVR
jgi:hypothetical protein